MASVHEQQPYDVAPDVMWQRIGDFHAFHTWHPAVLSQDALKGGRVRALHLDSGGTVTETLLEEGERSYSYRIDDSPLPVADYIATMTVLDGDRGGSVVDWRADFQAVGVSDDEAETIISGIFRAGLDALS
jgi:mxaD protein